MNYTPQQNGLSERFIRTLVEKARTLLSVTKFGKEAWGEAAYTATYIINRLPTRNGIIPAELWYGKLPNYKKLQSFGNEAYVHLQAQYREKGKFEEKSKKYYLVGYCNNGYKLWDIKERKIIRARDVIFNQIGCLAQIPKQESFSHPFYDEKETSKIQQHENICSEQPNQEKLEYLPPFGLQETKNTYIPRLEEAENTI